MLHLEGLTQYPHPGSRMLRFCGDVLTFILSVPADEKGSAWLRTNIGQARVARNEIIREVEHEEAPLGRDWSDIPMERLDAETFEVTVFLCEPGYFEAKCCFLRERETHPVWPEGDNTVINVKPAGDCAANIIYNAFVRQFGPNKSRRTDSGFEEKIAELDRHGYTVIPKSGTFRDLIDELDFIVGELGCRIIQLLPINPTPTTYGRMGRFGSPYAALSFTAVDSALAEFDPKATPLEQFAELVDAVHARNAMIILDIAINHTGWAAMLHETHPQWLARDDEGKIETPGAWGVVWADLTKLDFSHTDIWQYMAEVFLMWRRRGVDGFRCDAGYMIPIPAWKYIVARVREEYPDTVFFLEGLGGPIAVTRDLLSVANFNSAYSELFQNYDRGQIEHYLPTAFDIAAREGVMVNFAETHDNNRLAAQSHTFAKLRTTLCALLAQNGAFAFANGVEWYATEKINVHDSCTLNWGSPVNQVAHIRRLNAILKNHSAFFDRAELEMIQTGEGNHIAVFRRHQDTWKKLIIVANLDVDRSNMCSWVSGKPASDRYWDLLTDREIVIDKHDDYHAYRLEPGEVLCLTPDVKDLKSIQNIDHVKPPKKTTKQRLRAKAMDICRFYHGVRKPRDFDPDEAAAYLRENPLEYLRRTNPLSEEPRAVKWRWPQDVDREVMIPPDHFLMVISDFPFSARIDDGDKTCANENCFHGNNYFAVFTPMPVEKSHHSRTLNINVYHPEGCRHDEAPLLFLPKTEDSRVRRIYHRQSILHHPFLLLGTNHRGGMLRADAKWGMLRSKYDALLAANLSDRYPEDRWVMFTRCRGWVVFQGYSQEISIDCLDTFRYDDQFRGFWKFKIPCGQGDHVTLTVAMEMDKTENALRLVFLRHPGNRREGKLAAHHKIRLILRADIEDRSFHETTKAFMGPEHDFSRNVTTVANGFRFAPTPERQLNIRISKGDFVWEPEWKYMVHHPAEAERGMDPDSDLFSPGYFSSFLEGGENVELIASVSPEAPLADLFPAPLIPCTDKMLFKEEEDPVPVLMRAMDQFVVKRDDLQTVIAGYPWFLDWGRDTLIFVRGFIAANKIDESRNILKQFGCFEKDGTLPNMIRGNDSGNRDTSDAPLWFFIACKDIYMKDPAFLEENCNGRTVRDVLVSIANRYIQGTPNGIRMDPASGLIFSPSHFTWMDTNHPAGTPREGYPIEIQAFWHCALTFLSAIDSESQEWKALADRVRRSVIRYFYLAREGYLSDCLHGTSSMGASEATADDALRPNQLFAVTFDAVTDSDICGNILSACEELLVPGAIRSLADRPVRHPLPIYRNHELLNDPHHPYRGIYEGDEDARRKPAYHNGTAWTWVFPSFSEAWFKTYGQKGKETALAWLNSSVRLINEGCMGHVPEILDGNYPHRQRGCDAQAWGASELYRVWRLLSGGTASS